MSQSGYFSFTFGLFRLYPAEGTLTRDGQPLPLTPKEFDTLVTLVEASGRIVKKEELIARVWPDSFVGDSSLARNISVLRKTLGDGLIQTVPRRGYRLSIPVSVDSGDIVPVPGESGKAPPISPETSPTPSDLDQQSLVRFPGTFWFRWVAVVLCVLFVSAAVWVPRHSRRRPIRSVSIIVSALPAQDLQSEILTEAAGESVTHTLRRAVNLKVIAEHTLAPADQAAAVGRALGCDGVLLIQGERLGDEFRIRLAALDSNSGDRLWDETVTGRVTDAAWVDANVGEVVVRRFNADRQTQQQVVSNAAFQDYVRGRYFWNKRTSQDLEQAFASFRSAIQHDPNFALAYAGLAQTYAVADLHDPRFHGRADTYREAREAAQRALALDPRLASAHAALAQILRNYDRDMPGAEREYLKAIELDPGDATAHQWYAEFLSINGRHDEAIAEIDKAHELDPLAAVITAVCGTIRIQARRYAESQPFNYEALHLDPHYYSIYTNVAQAMEGQGRYLEALDALDTQAQISGDKIAAAAAREDRAAYLRGGGRALWQERLRRTLAQQWEPDQQYILARLYCRLGDVNRCFNMLERSVAERSETVTGIKIDPSFDIVHDDPRYTALVLKFGFTPDSEQTVSTRRLIHIDR